MNRRATLLSQSFVVISFLFASTSCKQGEGERCEVNSDCGSGLLCDISVSGGSSNGVNGICRSTSSTPTPIADAAVKRDTSAILDAKVDNASVEISVSSDGRTADVSSTDAISKDGTHAGDVISAPDSMFVDRPAIPDPTLEGDTAPDMPLSSDMAQDLALPSDAADSRLD
jgi:hypothetical protein